MASVHGLSVEDVSTHSRPKAAAAQEGVVVVGIDGFQHTAARRRLPTATTAPAT